MQNRAARGAAPGGLIGARAPANVEPVPSPIGHALGGALFGGLIAPRRPAATGRVGPRWWRDAAVLGFVGLLPDLDFLVGLHSRHTHGLGAAMAAGLVAWLLARGRARWGLAVAAAYASHILLDWLGSDTTPPIGIMALWPLSDAFYQSDLQVFMAIMRRDWGTGFWTHNLTAIAWELLLLGPPAALVWGWMILGGSRTVRERGP